MQFRTDSFCTSSFHFRVHFAAPAFAAPAFPLLRGVPGVFASSVSSCRELLRFWAVSHWSPAGTRSRAPLTKERAETWTRTLDLIHDLERSWRSRPLGHRRPTWSNKLSLMWLQTWSWLVSDLSSSQITDLNSVFRLTVIQCKISLSFFQVMIRITDWWNYCIQRYPLFEYPLVAIGRFLYLSCSFHTRIATQRSNI